MKKPIFALSFIMSLLMASQVMAWEPCNGHPNMSSMGAGWMSNLNLTQDQRAKLAELRQNFLKDTTETRSKLAATRVELRALFAQGAGGKKLKALHAKMLDLQRKLQERRFEFRLSMRKILTPGQLAMLPQGRGFMGGHGPMASGFMRRAHGRHGGCCR